jgi:cytidine deaminase
MNGKERREMEMTVEEASKCLRNEYSNFKVGTTTRSI